MIEYLFFKGNQPQQAPKPQPNTPYSNGQAQCVTTCKSDGSCKVFQVLISGNQLIYSGKLAGSCSSPLLGGSCSRIPDKCKRGSKISSQCGSPCKTSTRTITEWKNKKNSKPLDNLTIIYQSADSSQFITWADKNHNVQLSHLVFFISPYPPVKSYVCSKMALGEEGVQRNNFFTLKHFTLTIFHTLMIMPHPCPSGFRYVADNWPISLFECTKSKR